MIAAGLALSAPSFASEPSLPAGLGSSEPSLPSGLGGDDVASTEMESGHWKDDLPFDLTGFAETRIGGRLQGDANERDWSLGEARLQLQMEKQWDAVTASLTTDFLYDPVLSRHRLDPETGQGWMDLREANLLFRPLDNADVKIGRQTLTWGTGDLIFINDLFPKDWNAFFIGRDEEYLKAPSDAVKVALFGDVANLDIVYTPRFDSDRYIDGRRISYFNGNTGSSAGRNAPVLTDSRASWFSEDELALRLHWLVGPYETALYAYTGYWKSPNGFDIGSGLYTFPALSVYGGSIRGPLGDGIANAEFGYYDSRNDSHGNNPLIRNSEWRVLVGYEQEIAPELTGGVQYYLERMDDHRAYLATLPAGTTPKDQDRHLFTLRLTQLLMNQNLTLSLFAFYSPSDADGYLRPKAQYKLSDEWTLETGGNLFFGQQKDSFFGQFEDASNLYIAARYGF